MCARACVCVHRSRYNLATDVNESHNLMDSPDPHAAAAQAKLVARMAFWTRESAHVFDQNSLGARTLCGTASFPHTPRPSMPRGLRESLTFAP